MSSDNVSGNAAEASASDPFPSNSPLVVRLNVLEDGRSHDTSNFLRSEDRSFGHTPGPHMNVSRIEEDSGEPPSEGTDNESPLETQREPLSSSWGMPDVDLSTAKGMNQWLPFLSASTSENFSSHWFANCNPFVIRCSLLASISSGLLGYDIGVTSGALLFIAQTFSLSHVKQEIFVGILNLVSLVGALVAGRLADAVGRRLALLAASFVFFLGAFLMAVSLSYSVLLCGRIITGVGVGFGLALSPLYIAEISPAGNRGGLVSLGEVFINLGILLGFLSSFVFGWLAPPWLSWRLMMAGGVVLAIALGLAVTGLPESPRWLILHARLHEGERVLLQVSNDEAEAQERYWEIVEAAGLANVVSATLKPLTQTGSNSGTIQETLKVPDPHASSIEMAVLSEKPESGLEPPSQNGSSTEVGPPSLHQDSNPGFSTSPPDPGYPTGDSGEHVWKELLFPTPSVARMLVVLFGINFFQQATGIDATVYYSPVMFRQAGVQSNQALLGATLALGFIKVFFVLVAVLLMDRYGRRPLLLTSVAGMMLACLAQGTGFVLLSESDPSAPPALGLPAVLAVLANCTFVAFFSIGMGPINWLLTSEIFPLRLRAQAIGLGTAVNRVVAGVLAMTFLSMVDALGPAGPFFLFSGMCLLALVFFYFKAPETKGKSLEEVVRMFERADYARHPEYEQPMEQGPLSSQDGNRLLVG